MADKKTDISKYVQERAKKIAQALFKKPCKPPREYGAKKVNRSRKK